MEPTASIFLQYRMQRIRFELGLRFHTMDVNEILAHFGQVLDRVESGEIVPIERDGKVIGRFVPHDDEDVEAEGHPVQPNNAQRSDRPSPARSATPNASNPCRVYRIVGLLPLIQP
jgi:antitoxin (DNA-binding transcriptional repressor) of toxin-antitoxin stability system